MKVDTTSPDISNAQAYCDSYTDSCEQDDDTEIYFTWTASDEHSGLDQCWAELNDAIPDEDVGIDEQDTDTGLEGINTYYVRCRDNLGYWSNTISDTINISLDSEAQGI